MEEIEMQLWKGTMGGGGTVYLGGGPNYSKGGLGNKLQRGEL